jgi:PAS domain S-box-containing protein
VLDHWTPLNREVRTADQRWYLMRMRPYRTVDNKINGIVISLIEVTERHRAEERFRLAVEAAPSGMILVNSDGRIGLVNAHIERLFGYTREELVGQRTEVLVPKRFRTKHPGLRTNYMTESSIRPMGAGRDLFALRKDGSEFPVEIGLSPIATEQGMLVLAAIVNITERKRAEETQKLLTREPEHRTNNLLALVQSHCASHPVWQSIAQRGTGNA